MPDTTATRPLGRGKKLLTRQDHEQIQKLANIQGEEDYAVVISRGKGFWNRSTHVFSRQPTTNEINDFEQTGSRLKFRGQKAEVQGSAIKASVALYDKLIARAYDVLIGMRTVETMTAEEARAKVPPITKRAAITEWIGDVHGATRMAEMEGEDDDDSEDERPSNASGDSDE